MRPDKNRIEPRFKESLDAYVRTGRPTGGFLRAVLENNLSEAMARGDEEEIDNLPLVVSHLVNNCPAGCWGSPASVRDWRGTQAEEAAASR